MGAESGVPMLGQIAGTWFAVLAVNASRLNSQLDVSKSSLRHLNHYNLSPAFGIEITETALVELDDVSRNMVKTSRMTSKSLWMTWNLNIPL